MKKIFFLVASISLFLAFWMWQGLDDVGVGEGTYANLGTSDAADGSPDALTWDQGNGFVIDQHGKYILLTQNRVNTVTHWAWSNNDGEDWTQGSENYSFLTRGSIAYDENNDKLHVIWSATDSNDGIIYRRYGISRDGSNNITAIAREDSGNINLQLDTSGSCTFSLPSGIWVDDGSTNGLLVAVWSKNCTGDPQVRGSMRALSLSAADGVAGNWAAIDGTGDSFTGGDPAVEANLIYDGSSGEVGSSIKVRGGSGARSDDLYVFVQPDTGGADDVLAYRAVWSSGSSDWSGGWQSPVTVGDADTSSGYTLKWELISKIVHDSANDRLYVGWARWKSGGDGDTVSFAYLDSTDNPSSTFDAYAALGIHSYAPTLGISFDATLGNFIISYLLSTTNGDNGSIQYKTFDGSTLSSATTFYTSPGGSGGENGSADIPVMYPSRVDDRALYVFRVNGALPPTAGDPHEIYFGYESLATPTPTSTSTPIPTATPTPTAIPTPTSGGTAGNKAGTSKDAPVCTNQKPGSAPELYAATVIGGDEIEVYFNAADDPVDVYVIEYGSKSGVYSWGVDSINGDSRSFSIGGLESDKTYYFRIRGGNGCATGEWSNEISATTQSGGVSSLVVQDTELSGATPRGGSGREEEGKDEDSVQGSAGYELNVYVIDDNGKAVEGADVTVYSEPKHAKTDKNGLAVVTGLEEGQHRVVIAYDGYEGEESVYLSGERDSYELKITVEKKQQVGTLILGIVGGVLLVVVMLVGYWWFYRRK